MTDYKAIDNYLEKHLDDSIAELSRLAAQPSVGAQNWGLQECAALVDEMLRSTRLCSPGDGHRRRAGGLRRAQGAQRQDPAHL